MAMAIIRILLSLSPESLEKVILLAGLLAYALA